MGGWPDPSPRGRPRWQELELQMDAASRVLVPYFTALCILGSLLLAQVPLAAWLAWLALCGGFIAGREALTRAYLRCPLAERAARIGSWRRWVLLSAICFGAVWGCAVLLGFLHGTPTFRLFWTFMALAVATLSSCTLPPRLLYPQLAAILGPISVGWMALGDPLAVPVLSTIAAAVAVYCSIARLQRRRERELRALCLRNQRLSRSLGRRNRGLVAAGHYTSAMLVQASVSLRRPVQALSLLIPLLDSPDAATAQRRLWLVRRNVEALADILRQLLDFSRLELGLYVPRWQTVDLRRLVADVHRSFDPLACRKGVALSVDCGPAAVWSDARLLRRMIFSLVANAIACTERGRVRVEGERRDGDGYCVTVSDTGPGLPAELLEHSGLELSLVCKGAALLGHKVAVNSVSGVGTCITLTLRLSLAVGSDSVETAAGPLDSLVGLRVAIVENEPHVLEALAHGFRAWGCVVFGGTDVPSVERHLGGAAPQLVVSDLHLGGAQDGFAAIRWLRDRAAHASLPAIMLTGDLDPALEARARAEAIWLAHKPLRPSQLRQLAQRAIAETAGAP